jgi:hypothetical protein
VKEKQERPCLLSPRTSRHAPLRKEAMPIRFRCAYCNQLLGIARRKAGQVVRCPTCAGQVVVPNPEGEEAVDPPPPPPPLFERNDFSELFHPPAPV